MSNPVQNYINQINNIKIPENENNILNFLTTLDSNNQKMYLSFILSQSHIFDAMHQILETQNHKDFYRKAGYSDKTGNIVPKIDQDGKVFFEEFTSWDDTNKECREILNSLQNGDKQKWLEFVQYIKSIYEPNKMDIYFNPKNNKLHEDILVDFSRLNYSLHDNDLLKKQLEEINNNPAVIHEKGILNRIKGFISKIKTDRKHKQIKSKIQGDTAFVEKALNLIEKYKNNPDVTAITKKHLDFSEQLIKADLPKEVLSKVLLGLSYSPQSSSFSNNKIFEMEKHLSASAKIAQKMFSPEIVYAPNLQDMTKEIRNLLATYEIKEFAVLTTEYRVDPLSNRLNATEDISNILKGKNLSQNQIKEKMRELDIEFAKAQNEQNPEQYVRKCVDISMKFISIHPFDDGNGRTSRMLLQTMLARKGILLPSTMDNYFERQAGTDYERIEDEGLRTDDYTKKEDYIIDRVKKFNNGKIEFNHEQIALPNAIIIQKENAEIYQI